MSLSSTHATFKLLIKYIHLYVSKVHPPTRLQIQGTASAQQAPLSPKEVKVSLERMPQPKKGMLCWFIFISAYGAEDGDERMGLAVGCRPQRLTEQDKAAAPSPSLLP